MEWSLGWSVGGGGQWRSPAAGSRGRCYKDGAGKSSAPKGIDFCRDSNSIARKSEAEFWNWKTEDEERAAIQIRPSRALNYCHFFFSERDFIFRGGKSETSRLVTALYHHSSPSSTSFDTFLTFLSFKSHSDTFLFVYFRSLPLQGSATGIWLGYDSISGPYKDILLLPNSVLCILRLMKVLSFSFRCAFYFF